MRTYSCGECGRITPERFCPRHKAQRSKGSRGGSTRAWRRLRLRVFTRDRFKCRKCGWKDVTRTGKGLHCDHIRPHSKGGRDIPSNLQTLCQACNLAKGASD